MKKALKRVKQRRLLMAALAQMAAQMRRMVKMRMAQTTRRMAAALQEAISLSLCRCAMLAYRDTC
eukprot:1047367-Pleurochrysis_carterae.AAC.1